MAGKYGSVQRKNRIHQSFVRALSTPASGCRALGFCTRRGGRTRAHYYFLGLLAGFSSVLCRLWTLPVVHHLRGQYRIQQETRNVTIKNQLVIHLLQRSEDSGEGSHKVVEDLPLALA